MTIKRKLILLCLGLVSTSIMAQNYETCQATYIYHASHNESRQQAERKAINGAKVEALRAKFGSALSGASASSLILENNMTSSKFVSLSSEGELNGEWVADLVPPKVETTMDETGFFVKATVKGKGTRLSNQIDFEAKLLRNQPKLENESSEFVAGNNIFAYFSSPIDGYLAVYLLDGDNAYCLLPYREGKDGFFKINHGEEYFLFSYKKFSEEEDPNVIEEYALTANDDVQELNQIYFIFSPNKFRKPVDHHKQDDDGTLYPREMSWEAFQRWILKSRRLDKDMAVQAQYIVIKPKKGR